MSLDALRIRDHLRSWRLMALVLVLAVTALFSMVPFKVPRVLFHMPAIAVQEAPSAEPILHAHAISGDYQDATALEPVHGLKSIHPYWAALLPIAPLFAGVRALAGISVWKARPIALPPPVHVRLRAPPVIG